MMHPDWNHQAAYMQFRTLAAKDEDAAEPTAGYVAQDEKPAKVNGVDTSKEIVASHMLMMARIYRAGFITRENYLQVCKDLISGV